MSNNHQTAARLSAIIRAQVKTGVGKGILAAASFLTSRVKEVVSVPAPKRPIRLPSVGKKKGAIIGYRAKTKATPGAPPRVVSGQLRRKLSYHQLSPMQAAVGTNAKSKSGHPYPRTLELSPQMNHPFIKPTFEKYKKELVKIIDEKVLLEFS